MPIRPYDNKNQLFLLPPSVNEWVRADHPARVLSDIVDDLDVSGSRSVSTQWRPCYDPQMMVKVLLWGYATGLRASRGISGTHPYLILVKAGRRPASIACVV